MSAYFFDSSAIVKRYVEETGTGWVLKITDPAERNRIYVARITGVEVVSAIARRGRNGDISRDETIAVIEQFRNDFSREYFRVGITPGLIARAMSLAETRALRGYDALQLAAVLELNDRRSMLSVPALLLVSADDALNAAAMAEGLTVDNPNTH